MKTEMIKPANVSNGWQGSAWWDLRVLTNVINSVLVFAKVCQRLGQFLTFIKSAKLDQT